jgi:hypothetical protein
MKRTTITLAAAAVGLFALGAAAQSQNATVGQQSQDRMSLAQVATLLEGQGYVIHEIEWDDGGYEVEMRDANGLRVKAHLDPGTGEIRPYRDDDDHDYDDAHYGDPDRDKSRNYPRDDN